MMNLQHLTTQWLQAEASLADDVDQRAAAAIQALNKPHPRQDLVAAVMARIATVSIWARRPVHYIVASLLVFFGAGVVMTANSAPAAVSVARLPVWRTLGQRMISAGYQLVIEILEISKTVVDAITLSSSSWLVESFVPWLGIVLFLAGTASMAVFSYWRDEQGLNHA